jgi:hypothetical protein
MNAGMDVVRFKGKAVERDVEDYCWRRKISTV